VCALQVSRSVPPPDAVLDALSRYKVAIVALLRPTQNRWTADAWRAHRPSWPMIPMI
jgi:hypothetical protein